jgi:hypothetical protein
MIGILVGVAAGLGVLYEILDSVLPKPPVPKIVIPPPGVKPSGGGTVKPIVLPPETPVVPHSVPGGSWVYTAPQAAPDLVQSTATALAAVDPYLKSSEQIVRNFQGAAGLAQLTGPGANAVNPPGTDGRYGHDVAAVLGKYANAPLVSPTRASWWGPIGSYQNN